MKKRLFEYDKVIVVRVTVFPKYLRTHSVILDTDYYRSQKNNSHAKQRVRD